MSDQPEPDSGVWQDRYRSVWTRIGPNGWRCVNRLAVFKWSEMKAFGPLVPLIPDPGWEQDGEPVVCRVVRAGDNCRIHWPNGKMFWRANRWGLKDLGIEVSPEPEPSLADRLEAAIPMAWAALQPDLTEAAARLRELEANPGGES